MIGRVVTAQRLSQPGCLGQVRACRLGQHRQSGLVGVDGAAQYGLKGRKGRRGCERKPVSASVQDRLSPGADGIGDEVQRTEVDGGQVVEIIGVGEAGNGGTPARGCGGHPKMIQNGTAADDGLPSGDIGGARYPVGVEEQPQLATLGNPTPRLAVVDRRGAAGQCHRTVQHLTIDHCPGHGHPRLHRSDSTIGRCGQDGRAVSHLPAITASTDTRREA